MAIIKVPKTPKKAFDKSRRPSSLLLKQIEHLEWAVLPASKRKPKQLPKRKVTTEGQAAERIAQLTQMLLARHAATAARTRPAGSAPVDVALPPLPRVPREKQRSPSPRKRRTRSASAHRRRAARAPGSTIKKIGRRARRGRNKR